MTLFRGLSAFPITPADPDGRVDTASLRRLLRRLVRPEVDSVGLLGSTGAYPYLARSERRRALDAAMQELGGRVPVMVGIGALRTDEAVRLGADARAAGADAVLLAAVSYTPLSEQEVFTHFRAVAEATGLPLCIYDNPATTHFSFSDALVARLSREPYVQAVKSPAPAAAEAASRLRAMREQLPQGFSIGFAADWKVTEPMIAGADAWYSPLAGLFPELCLPILAAVRGQDPALARARTAQLEPLWALFRQHGSLRVMHAAAARLGFSEAALPLPLLPLPDEAQTQLEEILRPLAV